MPRLPAAALLALLPVAACGRHEEPVETPAPPPLILISIDTLRSDRLPAYGYGAGTTPAIDRLAREGVLFEHAFSPVPLTLPAHATLLTGLQPPAHGVRDNLGYRLQTSLSVVPDLRAAGYRTGAAVSSVVLRGETGLAAGFELYDDGVAQGGGQTLAEAQRAGERTLDAVEGWIERVADEPFFLFLHLYEPHTPYEPPPPFAGGDPYDGEISAADTVLARLLELLDRLDVYERAAILLLSDHGEGLGDHGEEEHGILLHREALQVPLVLKLPAGRDAGSRVAVPVHLADVAPTLRELAGLPAGNGPDGPTLLAPPAERPLYGETYHPALRYGWSELLSVVAWPYHLIEGPVPELYDLATDPDERHDLAPQQAGHRERLARALRPLTGPLEPPFTEAAEVRDRLADLGYLDFGGGGRGDARLDPKDHLASLQRLRAAMDDLRAGRPAAAERTLAAMVEENPGSLEAWQFLGEAYREQRRWPEAYHAFSEAVALSHGAPPLLELLAESALRIGRPAEAADLLALAVSGEPDRLPARFQLVSTLTSLGRLDAAAEIAEETVARTARQNPDALFQLALVRLEQSDNRSAEGLLRQAVETAPDHGAALYQLALLLAARGADGEAVRLLERALALDPDDARLRRSLDELRHRGRGRAR
jgi:arylsulfatase A-like enzyme/Tfp pilus assembly protein PilF